MLQWYEAARICSPCGTLNARQLGAQGGTKDRLLHTIDVQAMMMTQVVLERSRGTGRKRLPVILLHLNPLSCWTLDKFCWMWGKIAAYIFVLCRGIEGLFIELSAGPDFDGTPVDGF